MHNKQPACQRLKSLALSATTFLLCITALSAWAADSWQEEVLLHDGQKLIVERYVKRGGRHEVGQKGSYTEQTLYFTLPNSGKTIEWKDTLSEDLGNSSFLPMLLDIADGTPYLVVSPMGCLSYNKWGRPNPPYVVFKYDANTWQRIALVDLPLKIKTPNVIFSEPDVEMERIGKRFASAELIKRLVESTKQPEYKRILRDALSGGAGVTSCEELIRYKCGWGTPSEFNRKYFENTCK